MADTETDSAGEGTTLPAFHGNDNVNSDIEGDIHISVPSDDEEELNTLDEAVSETLVSLIDYDVGPLFNLVVGRFAGYVMRSLVLPMKKRDLKAVGKKFFHVLIPRQSKTLLRDWDLWGPLLLCILLAVMLQGAHGGESGVGDGGPEFAEVFVIIWLGASVVTLNSKLLGGNISFFQSVCVLGYCVLPLTFGLIICKIILFAHQTTILFAIRCLIVLAMFGWSTFASVVFLGESQPHNRKALAVYPIGLFYFVISWLVISHTG